VALPFLPKGTDLDEDPAFLVTGTVSRQGDLLVLDLRGAWLKDGRAPDGGWQSLAVPPSPPADAVKLLLDKLPVHMAPAPKPLLPTAPPAFWDLVRATASLTTNRSLEDAVMVGHRAVKDAPDCATAHFTVAMLSYHELLEDPNPFDAAGDLVDAAFRKGLALAPDHPRGLRLYCRTKSDAGRQKEALELLRPALLRHPYSEDLLWAVDYAARSSGLLELGVAARDRMNRLHAIAGRPEPFGYTYLYSGRLDLFDRSLPESQNSLENGLSFLERGYLRLLRGEREAAHGAFQRAEQEPSAQKHVSLLAKCYRLELEGQHAEARAALGELDRQRTGLRVPDGEFTFGMAEAAAFLGEEGLAMDLAQRAFSQGFACAPWFERSPMLAGLQRLPRWRALLEHVQERQAGLREQFRPKDFGL
jgi:tetratricopeptide (TPR) repeat protein